MIEATKKKPYFDQQVYPNEGKYKELYSKGYGKLAHPIIVARTVEEIIKTKDPKTRYFCNLGLTARIILCLPDKWVDFLFSSQIRRMKL